MVDQVEKVAAAMIVPAAAAIVDVWMGGDTAWRSRLDDSDFLESADWQNALELARAAIAAYNPNERLREALELVNAIAATVDTNPPRLPETAEAFDKIVEVSSAALSHKETNNVGS